METTKQQSLIEPSSLDKWKAKKLEEKRQLQILKDKELQDIQDKLVENERLQKIKKLQEEAEAEEERRVWDIKYSKFEGFLEIAKSGDEDLLKKCLDLNPDLVNQNEGGINCWTALMWCSHKGHYKCVQLLIDYGSFVDVLSNGNKTALMIAVWALKIDCAKWLIFKGANSNLINDAGQTVFDICKQRGTAKHCEMIRLSVVASKKAAEVIRLRLLQEAADEQARLDAIDRAIYEANKKEILAERARIRQENADAEAWRVANAEAILLAKKKAIEKMHFDETTLTLFTDYATVGNLEGLKRCMFYRNGLLNEQEEEFGWTALMWAAHRGHLPCVEYLIEIEANMDLQSKNGRTALMLAAWNGKMECATELILKGANIFLKSDSNKSVLDIAKFECNPEDRYTIEWAIEKRFEDEKKRFKTRQNAVLLVKERREQDAYERMIMELHGVNINEGFYYDKEGSFAEGSFIDPGFRFKEWKGLEGSQSYGLSLGIKDTLGLNENEDYKFNNSLFQDSLVTDNRFNDSRMTLYPKNEINDNDDNDDDFND